MERRGSPPRRVTSPTRGPPPPCKQALSTYLCFLVIEQIMFSGSRGIVSHNMCKLISLKLARTYDLS